MAEITNSLCFITTQNNISKASTKLFEPKKADTEMKGVGLDQAYLCTQKNLKAKKIEKSETKGKKLNSKSNSGQKYSGICFPKILFYPQKLLQKLNAQVKKPLQFLAISRPLN